MRTDVTIDEWIEALESGRYRKARGSLRLGDDQGYRHCCLGVLCDLAGTTWLSDTYNADMASFVQVVPERFGPVISDLLKSRIQPADGSGLGLMGHLMRLNDAEGDEDYTAVVKFLRNLP